ncbi:MAG TPA: ATP-binding cassette domain-containing protein [Steroidobacteraceae bacterium]|nr:ATP-binding cassette domain-containing protein [Steroidobacteraceae bacterium]
MNAPESQRLHALDAVRGFALLLGVAFHAALSFMPGWPPGLWAMVDNSPSALLSDAAFVAHVFRMSLFFFIAGFFARLLYHRLGARGFWANRGKRIALPLVIGWVILFPLIAWVWTVGITKTLGGVAPAPPGLPKTPGAFPLTHLWFLYQLLLLYAAVIGLRALALRLGFANRLRVLADRWVPVSIRSVSAVFVWGVPLAATLLWIPTWFYWTGIPTPDQSLIPQVPATVGFGCAFLVGWLVQRSATALDAIAARWSMHLLIGMAATAYLLYVVHTTPLAQPGLTRTLYAYAFGVALWGWVLGLTGIALRFLSGFSAVRRYVADASYWIYLAHLPVVAAFQVWVGHWPLHWSVKYPLVVAASLLVLFVSYHFLVRASFIGLLLNGRKARRGGAGEPRIAGAEKPGTVASLRGITKRYGRHTALEGIDLELRPGELLAVLGPNGAGKSTAISLWLGLIEADAGQVSLLGGSPQDVDRRRGLGVMMQDVDLYRELRVRELVALACSYYARPMGVDETLRRAGIVELADRRYGKLSGGQKRQVQFAVAICGRPRVLFLDEPTVGLDLQAREALWNNVRALLAEGCSIVLTTHYLEEAEALATRVAVLARGRVIASGSVDDMRALVSRRQIACETRLSAAEVRAWPGVIEATIERGRLHLVASDAEHVVRRLLAQDPALRRLEVREAGLSEAFNELTREAA